MQRAVLLHTKNWTLLYIERLFRLWPWLSLNRRHVDALSYSPVCQSSASHDPARAMPFQNRLTIREVIAKIWHHVSWDKPYMLPHTAVILLSSLSYCSSRSFSSPNCCFPSVHIDIFFNVSVDGVSVWPCTPKYLQPDLSYVGKFTWRNTSVWRNISEIYPFSNWSCAVVPCLSVVAVNTRRLHCAVHVIDVVNLRLISIDCQRVVNVAAPKSHIRIGA